MKLYNSQLEVTLKLSNLPFSVTEDVEKYELLKNNILSLNYEIKIDDQKVNVKPVINVFMDEVSHPFIPALISVVKNAHNLNISINPILISGFGLDVNKIVNSIENIVNTTLNIQHTEINKQENYTIESLENKIKRYNKMLDKHGNNKTQTNRISNKIIELVTKLEKLKLQSHDEINNDNNITDNTL